MEGAAVEGAFGTKVGFIVVPGIGSCDGLEVPGTGSWEGLLVGTTCTIEGEAVIPAAAGQRISGGGTSPAFEKKRRIVNFGQDKI